VSLITRLRLDACLYDPAPTRKAGKRGRTALKGKAQPKLSSTHTVYGFPSSWLFPAFDDEKLNMRAGARMEHETFNTVVFN
jgi:hypothetical protein